MKGEKVYINEDVCYTINTVDVHAVCYTPTLVLNDQGGAQMSITYDVTATLRQQMKHHEPIVLAYESHATDARYNPMGETCCTLGARLGTGGGQRTVDC